MSTAVKSAAAVGTIGGGALGGAALGGAFSSSEDKSTVNTQKATDKVDSVPSPKPTNAEPSSVLSASNPKTSVAKPSVTDPNWSSLSAEKDSSKDPYKGKIGETYGHLLTGTYGLSNKNNNDWWTKKFTQYTEDKSSSNPNLSSEFESTNVTSAFELASSQTNNPSKALNKVCDSVYKKEISNITPNGTTVDNKSKLKENLWKYCSNLETPPKTVQEAPISPSSYDSQAFGKTKETELLSVKDDVNVALWDLKQKEFFGLIKVEDPYFKTLFDTKNNNPVKDALKNKCKDAYSQKPATSGSSSPTQDEVVKYCSVKPMPATFS